MGHLFLIGFPNSGKTSLFNRLTGSNYKTVNYPGATTEIHTGHIPKTHIEICDTPGIHSIIPKSPDEKITYDILTTPANLLPDFANRAIIGIVIDASQLKRQLAIFRQLYPSENIQKNCVILLTMTDIAKRNGIVVLPSKLTDILGVPVYAVNGRTGEGLAHFAMHLDKYTSRAYTPPSLPLALSQKDMISIFSWVDHIVSLVSQNIPSKKIDLDRFFLHPVLGWVLLLGIMGFFFWAIFSLTAPITEWIDTLLSLGINTIHNMLPEHLLTAFFTQGFLSSIASVLVFIPQLVVLFFAIGLMEATGYLSRGAALVDRPLSAIGLNGRSFVPLLTGYACAIPAMLATRTIPSKKERLLTLFVIPLTSCSARLPVYGLLIGLLTHSPLIAGVCMTFIYIGSIVFVSVIAALVGRFLNLEQVNYYGFQIELPEWRLPQWGSLVRQVKDQTWGFIRRAGPLITTVGIGVWIASNLPSSENSIASILGHHIAPLFSPMGIDWRVGAAIILSFAAREVFVSALVTLFAAPSTSSMLENLKHATFTHTLQPIFTTPTLIGLVLFFMVSMQCASTFAIAKQEMGGWKLPIVMSTLYIVLGYILAVLSVQCGQWL